MNPNPNPYHGGPVSTLFDKLDPHRRKKLDECILNRQPATLRAIHDKFKLAESDISYQVLQRYARRLRDKADSELFLDHEFCPGADIAGKLVNHIERQFATMMIHDEPTPLMTQSMVNAYTKALQFKATIAKAAADQSRARQEAVINDDSHEITRQSSSFDHPAPRPQASSPKPFDPDASWDKDEDGTPLSHQEFMATSNKVLFDVYAPKSVKEAAAARKFCAELSPTAQAEPQRPEACEVCAPKSVKEAAARDPSRPRNSQIRRVGTTSPRRGGEAVTSQSPGLMNSPRAPNSPASPSEISNFKSSFPSCLPPPNPKSKSEVRASGPESRRGDIENHHTLSTPLKSLDLHVRSTT